MIKDLKKFAFMSAIIVLALCVYAGIDGDTDLFMIGTGIFFAALLIITGQKNSAPATKQPARKPAPRPQTKPQAKSAPARKPAAPKKADSPKPASTDKPKPSQPQQANKSRLYVGNLAWNVTDDDLKTMFSAVGEVKSVDIIKDKFTGESKGFGFVTMEDESHANSAIESLNGKDLKGSAMNVGQSKQKSRRSGQRRGPRRN